MRTGFPQPAAPAGSGGTQRWRIFALVLVVGAAVLAARLFGLGERLAEFQTWIRSLGSLGYLVFAAAYIVAVVAAVPGSAITLAGGALFGSVRGVAIVSFASTVGACLAFLIARYAARDAISSWLGGNPVFRRIDELTARQGAMIVALTRLVPLFPFNLLNYGFGLTRVGFVTYAFWSWLCMLPATVLFVVGADALGGILTGGRVPWPLVGVALAALTLLVALGWWAKRRLGSEGTRP